MAGEISSTHSFGIYPPVLGLDVGGSTHPFLDTKFANMELPLVRLVFVMGFSLLFGSIDC